MFDQLDKRTRLILLAITMTALCLAAIRLGHHPLWVDEAIAWHWTHLSIPWIVKGVQRSEPHGAFYYSVLKVWSAFGDSEFWLRFFSTLCFTLTAPAVYVIGQTMSGRRAGLYAACLTATAPFLIHYAQEVRVYAMLTLFCSLALMSAALLISRQSDRPPAVIGQGLRGLWRRWRRGASVSIVWGDDLLWATYIVAMLGGMYSHHTALLLPVVTSLIFLVAIAAAPSYRWRRLRNLIAASMVALALYVPNIFLLSASVDVLARFPAPTTLISFGQMRRTFLIVYGSGEYLPEQTLALAALCVLALWGWRRRKDWKWVGFALIGTLGLPLMLAAASSFYRPVFMERMIIWSSIPFYVACGAGLARLPSAGLRRIVLAGLVPRSATTGAAMIMIWRYLANKTSRWPVYSRSRTPAISRNGGSGASRVQWRPCSTIIPSCGSPAAAATHPTMHIVACRPCETCFPAVRGWWRSASLAKTLNSLPSRGIMNQRRPTDVKMSAGIIAL